MSADRNLLLGIIALQNNLIDRHQLVSAFDRWVSDKHKSLAAVLEEMQAIGAAERSLLESLVQLHLSKHGGDPQASLAALRPGPNVAQLLRPVADADLQASIGHIARQRPAGDVDPLATQMPSASPSVSGSRFRVLRPHAQGGLGEVFVAQDDELHRTVALKQIREGHANDPESRSRFLVEAEITGALEHPGIVPVYGLGHYADGRPYYAMRFIRGDSLKEAIEHYHAARKSGQPGGDALALRGLLGRMIDVCEAIEYAHCRGILHRDLKPGNVMVGRFGETLVVDWGLARTMDSTDPEHTLDEGLVKPVSSRSVEQTLMGAAVGTPHYMSPEQAMGQLNLLGPRSDVYSLGATLFCLLTGQSPVEGESTAVVLQKVQRGELRSLSQLNPGLDKGLIAICKKAMARDPHQRYARASDLAEDLERWLADEPVSALPETWLSRAGRWARRHRSLVTTIAAAAVLLMLTLAVSLWLVSAAHRREQLAHQQAAASFRAARQAVDRYFTQVSESTLLNQPGVQTLRKDLLKDALAYYETFLKEHAGDNDLQVDLAKANFYVGRIHDELGSLDLARQGYETSLAQLNKIRQAQPSADAATEEAISDALMALGKLEQKQGRLEQARTAFDQALELREVLAKSASENPQLQRKLANSHMNLGVLSLMEKDYNAAERSLQQAQKIRGPLASQASNRELRRDLAKGYYNLGLVSVERNQPDTAQREFQQAAEILESELKNQPADLEQRWLLATCYRIMGDAVAGRQDPAEAIASYHKALDAMQSLASRNPEVVDYQQSLAGLAMNLANVQADAQPAAARQSIDRAIQILQSLNAESKTMAARRDLAIAMRARGILQLESDNAAALADISSAAQMLEQLVNESPANSELTEELKATRDMLIR